MISCLCSFTALRTLSAKPPINKKRTRTLSHKELGSSTNWMVGQAGLEPAITPLWAGSSNHWTTGPYDVVSKLCKMAFVPRKYPSPIFKPLANQKTTEKRYLKKVETVRSGGYEPPALTNWATSPHILRCGTYKYTKNSAKWKAFTQNFIWCGGHPASAA